MIFYRADHTNLVVRIDSDEPLGILDTDYIEDYNGVDGQLTIFNTGTLVETALSMVALPGETPGIPDDVFQGSVLLSGLPDGNYQIRGRVRDLVGNYTILSAFASPSGGERIMNFDFQIVEGAFLPSPARTHTIERVPRLHTIQQHNRISVVDNVSRVHV